MRRRRARTLGDRSWQSLRDILRSEAQCRAIAGTGLHYRRGIEIPQGQAAFLMIPAPLSDADITARTDTYFNRTRAIVGRFGDKRVTYAVFLRRPVVCAPALMVEWLEAVARSRGETFVIELTHPEGAWVGAGEPLAYI